MVYYAINLKIQLLINISIVVNRIHCDDLAIAYLRFLTSRKEA